MTIPIYIVNFNTTELTNICVKSIKKNLKSFDFTITIFDNSDKLKFTIMPEYNDDTQNVFYLDNTKGQLLNLNAYVEQYSTWPFQTPNNFGSFKHTLTIDYIMNFVDKSFILFDSDTILKHDIDFVSNDFVTIAHVHRLDKYKWRFDPYIQFFNVEMMRENDIHYFDASRIMFGNGVNAINYDTGTSFYEDVLLKKLPYKEIQYDEYVAHFGNGSWKNADITEFININRQFI